MSLKGDQIIFRLLGSQDKESYRRIRLECLKNHPDNFGTTFGEESKAPSLKFDETLTGKDSTGFVFGAFHNETLVGICGFLPLERNKTKHRGEISQLYVSPGYAGKGVGSMLLKLSIEKAFHDNTIEQIVLGVVYTNENAVATYKKPGFKEYGMLENYFKQGDKSWSQLFMVLTRKDYIQK